MAWFARKAGQGAVRPALVRTVSGIVGGATAGEWPLSYERQLRDAYLSNPVAQRAVKIVVEAVGALAIETAGDDQAPARLAAAVAETVAAQLLLHGNAFVQPLRDADGAVAELFALRPERVTIEPDANGWPAAYRYRAGDRVARIPAREGDGKPGLIHLRALNPADDHYGLGCLGAAAGAVAIHNAATRWNKALLDNAARPSGALVYDPGEAGAALAPDQFERLRGEMEAAFAGAANAGRPMLLDGGLKWQALSLTPADMDFVGLKSAAAREIALAFGVPPLLIGLAGDNTYANYAEANRALYRLTVLPLAGRILADLGEALSAWWPDLAYSVDVDQLGALADERASLWRHVGAADFLSADEKRAMLGFGKREEADG